MGQGGFITLVNGTKYNWNRTNQHFYQMNKWEFPATIRPGESVSVYVEWDQGVGKNVSDDAGEADYKLAGTNSSFQISASARSGFDLRVLFTNLVTSGNPKNSSLRLGWRHDGNVNFILSGEEGAFSSSNPPTSWMQDNLGRLGQRTLRELCMPGSHDAGMSVYTSGTAFASACNTLTQREGILKQLQFGVRYFDIRPVLSGGKFYTGHYGKIADVSYQGSNGQSIESIISDVNAYTASDKELVVLCLSHDLNTDVGGGSVGFRPFNQDEWNRLFAQLKSLNNLFIVQNPKSELDLTARKLTEFIGNNRAAVVVVVEPSAQGIRLGNHEYQGFYTRAHYPVYDSYSEMNDPQRMGDDQLDKMKRERPRPDSKCFVLSWTLTQSTLQATTCKLGTAYSILDLAELANPQLYRRLLSACTSQCYPNILYLDGIASSDITAMAMAVNNRKLYEVAPQWSPQSQTRAGGTKLAPRWAMFNGKLWMVWKGWGDDGIWYATYDGRNWSDQTRISDVGTSAAPAIAVHGGVLYLAWRGVGSDASIWYATNTGGSWSGQKKVPNVGTSTGPALASFGNKLWMAWKGAGDDGIWYSTFDGQWGGQQRISGVGTSNSPALAVLGTQLHLTWRGVGSDAAIWWASNSGSGWSSQNKVPGANSTNGPTMAEFKGELWLAWKGLGDVNLWWLRYTPSTGWKDLARNEWAGTEDSPALAVLNDKLYMAWSGVKHEGLWFASYPA
ncbi:hypothetical protein ATI61_11848 [Archangium gephyra]|uniref:Cell surface protein n=1 Tax=Archangium gephyra TaxID=48 RepID=A0AAC8Q9D4_9BACT|nr:hypothetical protein [Archangium gephyra]AKJ03289.1 cell surface protein [Archangium gephyra]REG22843.1 hypothetical protein ATI61_11848 [Archangium gephyra]